MRGSTEKSPYPKFIVIYNKKGYEKDYRISINRNLYNQL